MALCLSPRRVIADAATVLTGQTTVAVVITAPVVERDRLRSANVCRWAGGRGFLEWKAAESSRASSARLL